MQGDSAKLIQSSGDIRELSTTELDQAAGGFVEVLAMVVASNYLYYQWLKANNKI
jgi:hypothetical protein